jgi:TatD DNase family protein
MLVDTHCHIHEPSYSLGGDEVLQRAKAAGVEKVICVGTNEVSSRQAVEFASSREGVFASIGVHPHDTKEGWSEIAVLLSSLPSTPSLVAIGEIGLDYFYTHSPRDVQIRALEEQLDLAIKHNLPVILHVREAFDDFWPVFDNFHGLRGVLHSFTDTAVTMEQALKRELYIGVNGISTFTKDSSQQAMFRQIPLEKMLLETDAPFLTPTPLRGTINEPAYIRHIMKYHAEVRGLPPEEIAAVTTANASAVFAI